MRAVELPAARRSQVLAYRGEVTAARAQGSDAVTKMDRDTNLWNVAELYFVTAEMTTVAVDAAQDMPPWTAQELCPTDVGFIYYDGGLPELPAVDIDNPAKGSFGQDVYPQIPADWLRWWRNGTILYIEWGCLSHRATHREYAFEAPMRGLGTLDIDLEGAAVDPRSPKAAPDVQWKANIILLLGCTWALMGQENAAVTHRDMVPSARRRRQPPTAVTTISLRRLRSVEASTDPTGRLYTHRWIVRGHWRKQSFGPGHGQRRPVWIPAYIKGPKDAPLKRTEKVNVWRR